MKKDDAYYIDLIKETKLLRQQLEYEKDKKKYYEEEKALQKIANSKGKMYIICPYR